jgi:hypothetical protein
LPGSYFGFGINATKSASSGSRIYCGAGNPNGILTAPQSSLWIDNTSAGVVYANTTGLAVWVVLTSTTNGTTNIIADPGTGVAIPVTASGTVELTIGAGAETNTLADPTFQGQILVINVDTSGGGTRAVTSANDITQTPGENVMTFGAVRDCVVLEGVTLGAALRWQQTFNQGVPLT